MIYACEDCGFLFRRFGKVEICPVCQSGRIRPGLEEEGRQLQGFLTLFDRDEKKDEEKSV